MATSTWTVFVDAMPRSPSTAFLQLIHEANPRLSEGPEPLRLMDVVHAAAGWPSDLAAVARVLDGADALLPEGRETYRPLSTEEVAALVLVAGGLDAEPAMALVDLARANDEAASSNLAGTVGLSREASTTLWAQTRRRLGVPVKSLAPATPSGRTSTKLLE